MINEHNLKQITKKNLSIYDIKTVEELYLIENENDINEYTPNYVFLSKYFYYIYCKLLLPSAPQLSRII